MIDELLPFQKFPKIPRLFDSDMIITEKIDGTNGCIAIDDQGNVRVGSRNKWLVQGHDHYGFRTWVRNNLDVLGDTLGPGYHYGEWWGAGINRGYDLTGERRLFSLFNVMRWNEVPLPPLHLRTVTVLYKGLWSNIAIHNAIYKLQNDGSVSRPGYDRPEGVVVLHVRSGQLFKAYCTYDEKVAVDKVNDLPLKPMCHYKGVPIFATGALPPPYKAVGRVVPLYDMLEVA